MTSRTVKLLEKNLNKNKKKINSKKKNSSQKISKTKKVPDLKRYSQNYGEPELCTKVIVYQGN